MITKWLAWWLDSGIDHEYFRQGYEYFYKQTTDKWAEIMHKYNEWRTYRNW